jgi:hypothetical protein
VAGPFFMFYAPELIFGGIGCDVSHFHILRSRTRFRWYRGRRVSFSYFALPDSFSTVLRASGLVFIFCVPRLIFGGTEGVGSLCDPFSRPSPFVRQAMEEGHGQIPLSVYFVGFIMIMDAHLGLF